MRIRVLALMATLLALCGVVPSASAKAPFHMEVSSGARTVRIDEPQLAGGGSPGSFGAFTYEPAPEIAWDAKPLRIRAIFGGKTYSTMYALDYLPGSDPPRGRIAAGDEAMYKLGATVKLTAAFAQLVQHAWVDGTAVEPLDAPVYHPSESTSRSWNSPTLYAVKWGLILLALCAGIVIGAVALTRRVMTSVR